MKTSDKLGKIFAKYMTKIPLICTESIQIRNNQLPKRIMNKL